MLKQKRTRIIIVIGAVILLAIGVAGFKYLNQPDEPASSPTSPINYGPPTEEEEADSRARKEESIKKSQSATASSADGKTQVEPSIVNAYQDGQNIYIGALVPNIVEDGGDCTITLKNGGYTITKTSKGFVNVSATNCTPTTIPRPEFAVAGDWIVTVSYDSARYYGNSQTKTLTVR